MLLEQSDDVDVHAIDSTEASWKKAVEETKKLLPLEQQAINALREFTTKQQQYMNEGNGRVGELRAEIERMSAVHSKGESDLAYIFSEITKKQETVQRQETSIEELQKTLVEVSGQLQTARSDLATTEETRRDHDSRMIDEKTAADRRNAENMLEKSRLMEEEQRLSSLQAEHNKASSDTKKQQQKLRKDGDALNVVQQRLQLEQEDAKAAFETLWSVARRLGNPQTVLPEEVPLQFSSVTDDIHDRISQLQAQLRDFQRSHAAQQANLKTNEAVLRNLRESNDSLREQSSCKSQSIDEWEIKHTAFVQANEHLKGEHEALKQSDAAARGTNVQLKAQLRSVVEARGRLREENKSLKQFEAANGSTIAQQHVQITSLGEANRRLSEENKSLKETEAATSSVNLKLKARSRSLQDANKDLKEEHKSAVATAATMQNDNVQLQAALRSLEETNGRLSQEIETAKANESSTGKSYSKLFAHCQGVKKELQKAQQAEERLRKDSIDMDVVQNQAKVSIERHDRLEVELGKLQQENGQLTAQHDMDHLQIKQSQTLASKLELQEKELQTKSGQLQRLNSVWKDLEARLSERQEQFTQTKGRIDAWESERALAYEDQIRLLQRENEDLQMKGTMELNLNERLRDDKKKLEMENVKLRKDYDLLADQVAGTTVISDDRNDLMA